MALIRSNVEFDGNESGKVLPQLVRYRKNILQIMELYELDMKAKWFVWTTPFTGVAKEWFQNLFEILQSEILNISFDQFCVVLFSRFAPNREVWMYNLIAEELKTHLIDTEEQFFRNCLDKIQDLPYLTKIFPLIVSTNHDDALKNAEHNPAHYQSQHINDYKTTIDSIYDAFSKEENPPIIS